MRAEGGHPAFLRMRLRISRLNDDFVGHLGKIEADVRGGGVLALWHSRLPKGCKLFAIRNFWREARVPTTLRDLALSLFGTFAIRYASTSNLPARPSMGAA